MEILPVTPSRIALSMLSPLAALMFAPLLPGIINKTKAFFAGRKGPPLLQPYFDLLRLFRKGSVYSVSTSLIFRAAPGVIFATTLAATMFIPFIGHQTPADGPADLILLLYLLAIARFFLILSALDTASAFEGMGASREAFYSALAEPVALLCLLNVMHGRHTDSIATALTGATAITDSISVMLSALPLFVIMLAENARIPFDDPNTHLELTMIHEVMILDNSGKGLALLEYAAAIKLWLFSLIIGWIILPVSGSLAALQVPALLLLTFIIAVAIGTVESVMARLRLLKVPQILMGAGVVALLGYLVSITGVLSW
jgi:formate hydrogenlyase subunit 4